MGVGGYPEATYHDLVKLTPRRAILCLELVFFSRQMDMFLFMLAELLAVTSSHVDQHRETHCKVHLLSINSNISRTK